MVTLLLVDPLLLKLDIVERGKDWSSGSGCVVMHCVFILARKELIYFPSQFHTLAPTAVLAVAPVYIEQYIPCV